MQGINFKESLFHLTAKGAKTETRRTGDLSKLINLDPNRYSLIGVIEETGAVAFKDLREDVTVTLKSRYKKGQSLYIKEPYYSKDDGSILYKYSYKKDTKTLVMWENKLFMPYDIARVFIKINSVRCERLQQIDEAGALREGIIMLPQNLSDDTGSFFHCENKMIDKRFPRAVDAFRDLFEQVNRKTGRASWYNNDWVFVYTYELINPKKNLC